MDMQKMQVRADLERMVYNYALMGIIENEAATKIVSFIGLTIGGNMPEPRGRIIAFPVPQNAVIPSTPLEDEKEKFTPFPKWYENFKDSGFDDYKIVGRKILRALWDNGINSLEELAKTPVSKYSGRGWGNRMFEIINEVLEKNGYAPKEKAL